MRYDPRGALRVAVASCALLVACSKQPVATAARPERRVVAHTVGPFPSDSTAAGVIRGIVVDDSTGRGVEAAMVSVVRQRRAGRGVGAITDKLGRFEFNFAPFDSITLDASKIGYTNERWALRLGNERAGAGRLGTRVQARHTRIFPHVFADCAKPRLS